VTGRVIRRLLAVLGWTDHDVPDREFVIAAFRRIGVK
jgi:hypothetical protein